MLMSNALNVEVDTGNGAQSTAEAENLRVVEQFVVDVWNNKDVDLAKQLLSPEYRVRFYGLPEKNYDDYFGYFPGQLQTWPDINVSIQHMFADGEWVSVRFTWTGTHTQTAFGVPPTGRVVTGGGIAHYRVTAGKVVEAWICEDMLSTLRSMGAIPEPG
jgi:predicted ester cyclase